MKEKQYRDAAGLAGRTYRIVIRGAYSPTGRCLPVSFTVSLSVFSAEVHDQVQPGPASAAGGFRYWDTRHAAIPKHCKLRRVESGRTQGY